MGDKKLFLILLCILFISFVYAVDSKVINGKTYYKVDATDPTEDSGSKVCAKIGMSCQGYTDTTTAACKAFHPNAKESSSASGDKSGIYCDGAPQGGVCSVKQNTCHTCAACTSTVQCNQVISGLYREMYVECGTGPCKITMNSRNVASFMKEIPSINGQLQGCPQPIPKGSSLMINGINLVNIKMNNGVTESFTTTVTKKNIVSIKTGNAKCNQQLLIGENDFNNLLSSSSMSQTAMFMLANKKITISGCTFLSKFKLFFIKPIANFIVKRQAPPTPPAPKPAPNCGNVGEQCNKSCR